MTFYGIDQRYVMNFLHLNALYNVNLQYMLVKKVSSVTLLHSLFFFKLSKRCAKALEIYPQFFSIPLSYKVNVFRDLTLHFPLDWKVKGDKRFALIKHHLGIQFRTCNEFQCYNVPFYFKISNIEFFYFVSKFH